MATKSSTQPAKSKLTTSQTEGAHSQVTPTTSTTTLPTPAVTDLATSLGGGLAELAHSLAAESGKRLEAARKSRTDSATGKAPQQESAQPKEPRERTPGRTPSTSLVKRYALELWVQMESSPGVYGPPDEDSYSVDFVVDTLNQTYHGCTGVYLSDAGHILAFYGKRGVPNASLTLEQGMEACMIIQEISWWKGSLAQVKVRAVSLQEAKKILAGLKCLEKVNLKRLQAQLSTMQLGSTLSVTAKPFTPLAASSGTVMAPSVAPRPLAIGDQPTRALYMSDDDGTTTDVSVVPKKKSGHKRGCRDGRRGRRSLSGSQTDSSSASSVSSRTGKKTGVTAKVSIPEYYGKGGHINHVSTFHAWAHSITYYCNYYEDHYLFPLVVALVKDNAAEMFDFACSNKRGDCEDLGQIVQRMREHYCGAFTFREQQIQVENMKQGNSEEAADFLVKVTNAVNGLAKDWKGHLTEEELDTLQYKVFLNGVKKEIHHVLDAEAVKHPHMTPNQMYTTIRRFESYVARNERLDGKEATPTRAKTPKVSSHATLCYKHRFHKTTAFKAAAAIPPEEEGSELESSGGEGLEEPEDVEEDQAGLFLPEFLGDVPDGDWGLHVRLAQAMQAEEKQLRRCFLCQSPDHLMCDCPTAKNRQRPLKPRGPAKNKSARVEAKAKPKAKAKAKTLPPPTLPAQPAPAK